MVVKNFFVVEKLVVESEDVVKIIEKIEKLIFEKEIVVDKMVKKMVFDNVVV